MDYNRPQIVKILQLTQDELEYLISSIESERLDWVNSRNDSGTPSWHIICDQWIAKLTELINRLK